MNLINWKLKAEVLRFLRDSIKPHTRMAAQDHYYLRLFELWDNGNNIFNWGTKLLVWF